MRFISSVGVLIPFILDSIYILVTTLAIFWILIRIKKEIYN